mmetsp:Transcript_1295/g.2019  ORF Transcript_1295/g.2019 Transcript_1295/m.2019 type:complete len:360 (-) Transcript_1295:245-1324(-)
MDAPVVHPPQDRTTTSSSAAAAAAFAGPRIWRKKSTLGRTLGRLSLTRMAGSFTSRSRRSSSATSASSATRSTKASDPSHVDFEDIFNKSREGGYYYENHLYVEGDLESDECFDSIAEEDAADQFDEDDYFYGGSSYRISNSRSMSSCSSSTNQILEDEDSELAENGSAYSESYSRKDSLTSTLSSATSSSKSKKQRNDSMFSTMSKSSTFNNNSRKHRKESTTSTMSTKSSKSKTSKSKKQLPMQGQSEPRHHHKNLNMPSTEDDEDSRLEQSAASADQTLEEDENAPIVFDEATVQFLRSLEFEKTENPRASAVLRSFDEDAAALQMEREIAKIKKATFKREKTTMRRQKKKKSTVV